MSEKPEEKNSSHAAKTADLKFAQAARNYMHKKANPGPLYAWPMGAWFLLFFVVPLAIIVVFSFMERNVHGGVLHKFSLEAYSAMFTKGYGVIFCRTLFIAAVSTLITILIALPSGYAMARSHHQTIFLILVIVPFLTNSLIRIFAWKLILGDGGLINQAGAWLSTIVHGKDYVYQPIKLMYTRGSVILVGIYLYLPYAILPVFTAIDRFDFSLLEAARDLGATKSVAMFKVLIPNIKHGIISAIIFTFIPIFGTYTIPDLVGGKSTYMLGNIIYDQVKIRNWPLSSAFSVVISLISIAGVLWMLAAGKKEASLKKTSNKEDNSVSLFGGRK